jgi:hypothetical protein
LTCASEAACFLTFDPFTLFTEAEGPLGTDIENLLEQTDIQQALIDPILGLFGPLAGIFTT